MKCGECDWSSYRGVLGMVGCQHIPGISLHPLRDGCNALKAIREWEDHRQFDVSLDRVRIKHGLDPVILKPKEQKTSDKDAVKREHQKREHAENTEINTEHVFKPGDRVLIRHYSSHWDGPATFERYWGDGSSASVDHDKRGRGAFNVEYIFPLFTE